MSAVDAQQVFQSTFKALINEDYPISADIDRYQSVLEHALSKVDFSIGTGIYMLPNDLKLSIGKTVGYNSKILVGNTDIEIGSNNDINRGHKKLRMTPPEPSMTEDTALTMDKSIKERPAAQHEQTGNQKMLAEKHNDDKLAITIFIVGAGLIAYRFWYAHQNRNNGRC